MPFVARSQRAPRAWALPALLLAMSALAGCTTSFDPSTRPRRDAGVDALVPDTATDAPPPSEAGDVAPDARDVDGAPDAAPDVADDVAPDVAPDVVTPDGGCGPCAPGEICCDGACTDPDTDPNNCRACGHACPGTACVGGSCSSSCLLGFADCDHNQVNGCEQDLATSAANCGSCGVACPDGRPCVGGVCACPAGSADCDGNPTNGCEVDTDADPASCGACGAACRPNQACVAGACACAPGFGDCDGDLANGCEADLTSSSTHCGDCRTPCGLNASCVAGVCACGEGLQRCPAGAADCTTSLSDPNNCGGCGITCGAGLVCTPAGCGSGCGAGETLCGSSCVNLDADLGNCGDCGIACAAGANASPLCRGGVCAQSCNAGFADCDDDPANGCETDVGNSNANCGACGRACTNGHQCVSGQCTCPGGQRDCNGTCADCCTDAQCPALDNCMANRCVGGTCQAAPTCALNCCPGSVCRVCCSDAQCAGAGANRGCGADGTCSVCLAGYGDCDGDPANGCESALATSANNCGACGNRCSFPNAAVSCVAGACVRGACDPGYADCDGVASNGCEANLNADPAHCGSCANACSLPGGTNVCAGGTCAISTCAAGMGNCDTSSPDCETNLTTSASNCGACGNRCSFANAAAACASGGCVLASCNAGYGNCDSAAGNGCETDLRTSAGNCGACGNACNLAHATAACSAGGCVVVSCAAGYGDCDGVASNGCETDLRTSAAHCGTCATACAAGANAAATCTSGSCGFTCAAGYGDCDGAAGNGCETNLQTSVAHCGTCATVCSYAHAQPVCSGGVCSMGSCESGYSNCDGAAGNGCEVNTASSTSNCGGCNVACSVPNATPACAGGGCAVASCNAGYRDCDGNAIDGCELECGAGRACGSTAGTCAPGWQPMSTANAPSPRAFPFYALARSRHEIFVWGGVGANGAYLADGARYNWDTDTWTALPAPPSGFAGRAYGQAVWTGSEFVVWGGRSTSGVLNTGARYQPGIGWRVMASANAPAARDGFFAGLTADGRAVIFQGGQDGSPRGDGGRYDLVNDAWYAIAAGGTGAHALGAWVSGQYLAVFGGTTTNNCLPVVALSAAKVFDAAAAGGAGGWTTAPSDPDAPGARWFEPNGACPDFGTRGAVDAAGEMFIWGGTVGGLANYAADGALWNLSDLSFRPINATPPAVMAGGAFLPVLVSTGAGFLGWSPVTGASAAGNDLVFRYDPVADAFTTLAAAGGPPPIIDGAAYGWTGSELIVWGGRTGSANSAAIGQGGRYAP